MTRTKPKKKGKKKKSEFDDFFNKPEKKEDGGWVSGVSAMALDGEEPASLPEGAAADMEVGDAPPSKAAKGTALGVQKVNMKAVRGQRSKAQKLRKSKLAEKATARADKTVVKIGSKTALKQKKSSLKHIY